MLQKTIHVSGLDVSDKIKANSFIHNTQVLSGRRASHRSDICKGFISFYCGFTMDVYEKIFLKAYINHECI